MPNYPGQLVTDSQKAILRRRIRCISQWGGICLINNSKFSNGTTQLSGTDLFLMTLFTDAVDVRFAVVNSQLQDFVNYVGNDLTFNLAIEEQQYNQQVYSIPFASTGGPVSAGGHSGTQIGDGQMLISAPISIGRLKMLAGQVLRVRCYKVVTAGKKWPYTIEGTNPSFTGQCNGPPSTGKTTDLVNQDGGAGDQSDVTISISTGTLGNWKDTSASAFAPIMVIGEQATPKVVVGIFGDSIPSWGNGGRGYVGKALDNGGINWHMNTMDGQLLLYLANRDPFRPRLAEYYDYLYLDAIRNDIGGSDVANLTQAKAAYLGWVRAFGRRTNKIVIATVLPNTTSTDGFATVVNQTRTGFSPLILTINNWLRDPRAGGAVDYLNTQAGVLGEVLAPTDPAALGVECNSDGSAVVLDANGQQTVGTGGYWKAPSYTSDGNHPLTAGINAAAASFNAATKFPLF